MSAEAVCLPTGYRRTSGRVTAAGGSNGCMNRGRDGRPSCESAATTEHGLGTVAGTDGRSYSLILAKKLIAQSIV